MFDERYFFKICPSLSMVGERYSLTSSMASSRAAAFPAIGGGVPYE
jgi:hypothetical protein